MACACKSNNGAKKQVSQITKRTTSPSNQVVRNTNTNAERKQIVIRRPSR
jgi:hypothetical protein